MGVLEGFLLEEGGFGRSIVVLAAEMLLLWVLKEGIDTVLHNPSQKNPLDVKTKES